jgi:hypothetical protein
MKMMRLLAIPAAALTLGFSAAHAADKAAGEAVAVIDKAEVSGKLGTRKLSVGAEVRLGELVTTDDGGEAQLLFSDGTRMVVGPNSKLVIEDFVFRKGSTSNKFAVRALGGAFRFIAREGGENDDYVIRTPTATIGVRG